MVVTPVRFYRVDTGYEEEILRRSHMTRSYKAGSNEQKEADGKDPPFICWKTSLRAGKILVGSRYFFVPINQQISCACE